MSILGSIIDMGFLESDAEAILALPAGMVTIDKDGIERDMSLQEVVEWAIGVANSGNIDRTVNRGRVEVKK